MTTDTLTTALPGYYTLREAMQTLGVSRATLVTWERRGYYRAVRPARNLVLIPATELEGLRTRATRARDAAAVAQRDVTAT